MTTEDRVVTSRGSRSRADILDAAERILAERGLRGLGMSALIGESGLSPSSIYWHFSSKAGVIDAVMERAAERFVADRGRRTFPTAADPQERTRLVLLRWLTYGRRPSSFLLLALAGLGAATDPGESDEHRAAVEGVRVLCLEALEADLRTVYDGWGERVSRRVARVLARPTLAMIDGLLLSAYLDGDDGLDDAVETLAVAVHQLAEAEHESNLLV